MNIINHHHHVSKSNNEEQKLLTDLLHNINKNDGDSSWVKKLIDSSHLITFCISISVIIYGSFRSLNIDANSVQLNENENATNLHIHGEIRDDDEQEQQTVQTIDSTQALIIPVAASISLLLMFFFFDSVQTAFLICTSILAIVTFAFLLQPVCLILCKKLFRNSHFHKLAIRSCIS